MLYGVRLTPNTKWKPGYIIDVLPNQSYLVELEDGRQFRRNEHHITGQQPHPCNGAKCRMMSKHHQNSLIIYIT